MAIFRQNLGDGGSEQAVRVARRPVGFGATLATLLFAVTIAYLAYFWFVRRVVVGPGHVLVVMRKDAGQSLPGDQVIIPRPPDAKADAAALAKWQQQYADTNGILEQVYPEGTYFRFSPFDYQREIIDIRTSAEAPNGSAEVPNGKFGIVVRKFGKSLPPGQVLADPQKDQRGPLAVILRPGRYNEYANPYAYEIKQIDPLNIDPGHRGVVTQMAGRLAAAPNSYLVEPGEQGTQRHTEPEGFLYANPFEKRIIPVEIRSHRFAMSGDDAIRFPSSDSFEIKLDGFVEWSIVPEKLPLVYVQYGEGNELIPHMEEKVILPYARSFSRLVGSRYNARDFISGDTKLKFQDEFEAKLREACAKQGIEVLQALVRDIEPPKEIKDPINEREIAKQQINSLDQQIEVAHSKADLATQEQIALQNQSIGEANMRVVTIVKQAEQARNVALTQARQRLEVARLQLEAAQKEADALVARGQADANVILLNKQAEAEPLRQQVNAFGGGDAYARYVFNQRVAPAVKTILADSDGTFAELFRQFLKPPGTAEPRLTGVQP